MKMGKLFSSIATATMVLTTLAPVAVANAATGHSTNVAGNGVAESESNGSLPMATSAEKDSQDSGQVATAKSDANVKVIDGFLVLNSVPDFGFGAAIAGSTVNLHDGNSMRRDDGNDQGKLEVIDSRTATKDNGFTVNASIGEFANSKNEIYTPSASTNGNFALTLKSIGVSANANSNFGGESTITRTLNPNDQDSLILQAAKSSRGTHTFQYRNASPDATLKVPDGVPSDEYSASITWKLAPVAH